MTRTGDLHPTLVDSAPYVLIVRALLGHHHRSAQELAVFADVGVKLVYELAHGKTRVQAASAEKLNRLVALLPSDGSAA